MSHIASGVLRPPVQGLHSSDEPAAGGHAGVRSSTGGTHAGLGLGPEHPDLGEDFGPLSQQAGEPDQRGCGRVLAGKQEVHQGVRLCTRWGTPGGTSTQARPGAVTSEKRAAQHAPTSGPQSYQMPFQGLGQDTS